MEIIVKYHGDILHTAAQLGASAELLSSDYAILTLPEESLSALYGYPEIEDLELPRRLYFENSVFLAASCIPEVQRDDGLGLKGSGVIIGVVDSGIDYTHPDFRNEDGSTRIVALWDQTLEGSPPDGFAEGSEFEKETINQALESNATFRMVPSRDYNGHGTAVAGIAAGNGRASGGMNMGTAPLADLLIVKVGRKGSDSFARTTEIMRGVRYCISKARRLGQPLVLNLSFGMNDGAHNGSSLFEEYLDEVSNEWKTVIVVPTGNEGAAGHHFSGTVQKNGITDIGFFTGAGIERFYLSLWKNFVDQFSVELLFPNGRSTGLIGIDNQTQVIRTGNVRLTVLYSQPTRYSVGQEIFLSAEAEENTIAAGTWILRIHPENIVDGIVNVWLPTLEEVGLRTAFAQPTEETTMTIPSTARKVIRVAGYNDRLGSIAPFSGQGSKQNCLLVPDIAAPAVKLPAPRPGGGYDSFTGTSFASPIVAGASALMMEWGIVCGNAPYFYGERVRAYLRLGALRGAGPYPDAAFGYGKLCLRRSFDYMIRYAQGGTMTR